MSADCLLSTNCITTVHNIIISCVGLKSIQSLLHSPLISDFLFQNLNIDILNNLTELTLVDRNYRRYFTEKSLLVVSSHCLKLTKLVLTMLELKPIVLTTILQNNQNLRELTLKFANSIVPYVEAVLEILSIHCPKLRLCFFD